jgi:hypothetical protein
MTLDSNPSLLPVEQRDLVLIYFNDPIGGKNEFWIFSIDARDVGLLEIEIAHYNTQIERICQGLAGQECYEHPEDRNAMYLRSEPDYYVGDSENTNLPYALSSSDDKPELFMYSYSLNRDEIVDKFGDFRTDDFLHPDALLRLITHPLCADQSIFSLGHRLLPLTDDMLTSPENFTPDTALLERFGYVDSQ